MVTYNSHRLGQPDAYIPDTLATANAQRANVYSESQNHIPPLRCPTNEALAPMSVPHIRVVESLDQDTYLAKQPVRGIPAGPIRFNGEHGVTLSTLDTLMNGNSPAFDDASAIGVKASMRFKFRVGLRSTIVPVGRRVLIGARSGVVDTMPRARHTGTGPPRSGSREGVRGTGDGACDGPARFRRAQEAHGESQVDLESALTDAIEQHHAAEVGEPLTHKGHVVRLDEIVLLRIEHVSRGSLQPILGICCDG